MRFVQILFAAGAIAAACGTAASPTLVSVAPRSVSNVPPVVAADDAHVRIRGGHGGRVWSDTVYTSKDGRYVVEVARYERLASDLRDWPSDEFMFFTAGRVRIGDERGWMHEFAPGEAVVVPRGYSGSWDQAAAMLQKVAVTYSPAPGVPTGPAGSPALLISRKLLEGRAMEKLDGGSAHFELLGSARPHFVEVPVYRSKDGRFLVSIKRYTAFSARLIEWPVDEYFQLLEGRVRIEDEHGVREFGKGAGFLIPAGYSGVLKQLSTVDMLTVEYGENP